MPPAAAEYVGPEAIGRFLSTVPAAGSLERFRLVPTRANGQPASGCYLKDPHSPIAHAYGLMVLTLRGDHVAPRDAAQVPPDSGGDPPRPAGGRRGRPRSAGGVTG